jgi:broad specificity phosphatase PhoE
MTALFVVRHPQTTWNVEQRYQGRQESPLSEHGLDQSRQVAQVFAGEPVQAVYSSPLQRALHLAAQISQLSGAPLVVDERFTEIALGPWEGLYRHEIELRYPELYRQWYTQPEQVRFPGGESLADVHNRSRAGLETIFSGCPHGNVVLVSHSAVIQSLVAGAMRIPPRHVHSVRVSNGSITILCGRQPPGSVLSLNSTMHLFSSPIAAAAAQNCVSLEERRMTL